MLCQQFVQTIEATLKGVKRGNPGKWWMDPNVGLALSSGWRSRDFVATNVVPKNVISEGQ